MKEFNTTGVCIPERHYMADVSKKVNAIKKMVEAGKYFTINKPRQFGKTTIFYLLKRKLIKTGYLVLKISFEMMSSKIFQSEKLFIKNFLRKIKNIIRFSKIKNKKKVLKLIEDNIKTVENITDLNYFITDFVESVDSEVVLMIDEVDKSSNNQLFLDFLGILRNKFLLREQGEDYSFKSVILAGVHDVKNLKLKVRDDEEHKYNSPWNIASEFKVDFELEVDQIASMLKEYRNEREIDLDLDYFSEKIYYYTSGHPFLVSKLAEIIAEEILGDNELSWKKQYLEKSVKIILGKDIPNFNTLIKNIEKNSDLEELIRKLLMDGRKIVFNNYNPKIKNGILYGIFKDDNSILKIHNRIYEQLIYNYWISQIENSMGSDAFNFKRTQ